MKIFTFFTRLHVLYEIKIITYSNKNYYICNPKSDLFKINMFKNKTINNVQNTYKQSKTRTKYVQLFTTH